MKHLLPFLFLLGVTINAQSFEKIFETKISQKQEFANFLSWSSQNQVFIKNKEILSKDSENGQILTSLSAFNSGAFLNFATSMTLKADLRENKYRLSTSDPVIVVSPKDFSYGMSSSVAKIVLKDLESAKRISEKMKNVTEWQYSKLTELLPKLESDLTAEKSKLSGLTKKRDIERQNEKIEEIETDISKVKSIIKMTDDLIDELYKDIDKTVNVKDDF